jgi:hypothetical protein
MPATRYFGVPPDPVLLRRLGLALSPEALHQPERFHREALEMLDSWKVRLPQARERVALLAQEPTAPEWWGLTARDLVHAAHAAGLRFWLDQVFGAEVSIRTPSDLRWWCLTQLKTLEVIQDAYSCRPCIVQTAERGTMPSTAEVVTSVRRLLDDRSLLAEATRLMSGPPPDTPDDAEHFYTRLRGFAAADPGDKNDEPVVRARNLRGNGPRPTTTSPWCCGPGTEFSNWLRPANS